MVMNLILVFLVCECNEYVIPKSMSRKDLGYKSKQFLANPLHLSQEVHSLSFEMASRSQSFALSVHFVVPRLAPDSNLVFISPRLK
jgi:hypothetical protein